MRSLSQRIARLERLTVGLTAAAPAGGPAARIKSDYGPSGPNKKKGGGGGGRKVASKAGEKRYGLPIGTPLGQTRSKGKNDSATKASYESFMAAKTPAELNKAASWMSTDDLRRTGEALFSFDSKNERDEAARISLVKELADRGIDPRSVGYKGGPVVLNPNPKQDPVERAAQTAQRKAESAARKTASDTERAVRLTESTATKAAKDAATAAEQKTRQALGQAIAEGAMDETEARRRMKSLKTG